MKLTHVTLEGCGRFGRLARVEGFGPGVNILSAHNEAGKSTIFRAIRTCLFERHGSVKEEIQALATEGLTLPVTIAVAFEKDGKAYEIRKSFLRSKQASLVCEGVEVARNAEADEEVWKLLGIEQRSTRALDEAAYGLLWVAQGRSFETPDPSEGAKNVLNAVIQQEVGTLVGGERARHLVNGVNEELGRYVTRGGQPKANGPLDLAMRESSRLAQERLDAEAGLETLREKLEELDALRRELRGLSDPAAAKALQDQLAESKRRLAEAEKAAEEINRLAGEERQAHQLAEAQQEKLAAVRAQAEAIDARRLRLKQIAAELRPLDEQEKETAEQLAEATAAKTRHDQEWEALDAREAGLQRLEALALKLDRRAELERRLGRLEDFRQRAAASAAALKAASVDEAAVRSLEAIEREESRIRDALEAGAARLAITAKPGSGVTLNGAAIEGNALRPVTEPLTIAIGADVSITVSPPPEARGAAAGALEKERGKLRALLAAHGVGSAAELRQRRGERAAIEDAARDLRAERSALGIGDDLAAEIGQLAAVIGEMGAEAKRVLPEGSAPLPPPEEIAAERQAMSERRSALRAGRSACEGAIAAHTRMMTSLADQRGSLRGQRDEIHAQLQSALALLPDETRAGQIAASEEELGRRREAHRIKAAALEQGRASAPPADEAERQRGRIERFTASLESQKKSSDELREKIARLEGEVKISGGEGLGEQVAALRLQQEMAAAEASRLAERVEVLKLLRDTVDDCYRRRREQLNAPLVRHLQPFLGDVFPQADIELGENFAIAKLGRAGPQREPFEKLSLGTQEQIAVLVRLAMGAMICERGADVPIILDDALVFSDDERIEQMFDAINRAGRNQQVIVLTCRKRSFASLGGRALRIV